MLNSKCEKTVITQECKAIVVHHAKQSGACYALLCQQAKISIQAEMAEC